jgi:hypothetical protein
MDSTDSYIESQIGLLQKYRLVFAQENNLGTFDHQTLDKLMLRKFDKHFNGPQPQPQPQNPNHLTIDVPKKPLKASSDKRDNKNFPL